MRIFFLLLVLIASSSASKVAELDAMASLFEAASLVPQFRQSIEISKSFVENTLRDTTADISAMCDSQARNISMYSDSCGGILTQLQSYSSAIAPGSSSATNLTSNVIAAVCKSSCFQSFSLYMQNWVSCLQANGLSTAAAATTTTTTILTPGSTASISFSQGMSALTSILQQIAGLFCLQNAQGVYCLVELAQIGTSFSTSSFSMTSGTTDMQQICNAITSAGCCYGSVMTAVMNIANQFGGSTSQEITQEQQTLSTQCGVSLQMSCMPTASSPKLLGTSTLSLLWSLWSSFSAQKKTAIQTAVCTDLAAAGGFYAPQCTVTGVTQSSRRASAPGTAFNYQIMALSTTQLQQTQADINSGVSYSTVSSAAGTNITGVTVVAGIQPGNPSIGSNHAYNAVVVLLLTFCAIFLSL